MSTTVEVKTLRRREKRRGQVPAIFSAAVIPFVLASVAAVALAVALAVAIVGNG